MWSDITWGASGHKFYQFSRPDHFYSGWTNFGHQIRYQIFGWLKVVHLGHFLTQTKIHVIDCTSLKLNVCTRSQIFSHYKSLVWKYLLSYCVFVRELLCQSIVVCCNSIFHCDSLHMDYSAILHIRVELARLTQLNLMQNPLPDS